MIKITSNYIPQYKYRALHKNSNFMFRNALNVCDSVSFSGKNYRNDNKEILDDAFSKNLNEINVFIKKCVEQELSDEQFLDLSRSIIIKSIENINECINMASNKKHVNYSIGHNLKDLFFELINESNYKKQPELYKSHAKVLATELKNDYFFDELKEFVLQYYNAENVNNKLEEKARSYYQYSLFDFNKSLKHTYLIYDSNYGCSHEKDFYARDSFGILCVKFIDVLKQYHQQLNLKKLRQYKEMDMKSRIKADDWFKILNARERLVQELVSKQNICKEIRDFNSNSLENLLPNSIVISHPNKQVQMEVLNWLIEHSNSNKSKIVNTQNLSSNEMRDQLYKVLKNNEDVFKKTSLPGMVCIEGFDKFINTKQSRSKLAAMKKLLVNTWNTYHSTIVFTTTDISNIDNICKQPHRSMVIDIENDPIIERLEPLKNDNLKIFKDGYRIKYGKDKDDFVDIYLGCFGHSKDILWIDSQYIGDIKIVNDNMQIIKQKNLFKDVQKIQCTCSDTQKILSLGFLPLNDVDINGNTIYEKKLNEN